MEKKPCSVNTDYLNDIHSWQEIERQLRNIAGAGFTHVQWIHDWSGEYLYSPSEMFQARDALRFYGLNAHTLHATEGGDRSATVDGQLVPDVRRRCTKIRKDYTSTNEYNRLAGVDLLKNRIDLCSHIGASAMVLHMQLPIGLFAESPEEKEAFYRQVTRSFDEVQPYARAAGVRIAMENLPCIPFDEQDEMFRRVFERYDEDFMGLCYDSGHAAIMNPGNEYYFLETYSQRLAVTHLQDNDGLDPALQDDDLAMLLADLHQPPFTGVLDWQRIAKGVAASPLALPADFEVMLHPKDEADEMAQLIDCREKAQRFQAMVEGYRI